MHVTKVLLGLSLLLATTYARPEGYGVKGGRNHKSSANAAAFAQASAIANGGCSGIAQSSASATASANANASGGSSNAAATANAFANAGNIGKAISCDGAIENANPLDDSNDLRLSNNQAKDLEKKSDKQENGRPTVGHHIAISGSDDNTGSVGITNQNKDHRPGCEEPGVKGHRGGSKCSGKDDKENNPSVSNPYPTHHTNPGWSAGSKSQQPVDGGYGGNPHNSGPGSCSPGTSGCSPNKPSVSNPYPTQQTNSGWSADSESQQPVDGGHGGNSPNSGSSSCSPGTPGCSSNKPSVSNTFPTQHKNPEWSTDSKSPAPVDSGYGGNSPNLGSGACTPGTSGCSSNKPSVSYPYPSQHTTPDWSAGSESQPPVNGGYGGNSPKSGSSSCSAGTPGCSSNKPSVSNPYPTQHKNPEWSTDSKSPAPVDSGYGGNSPNLGSSACTPGTSGCSSNKPSVSYPYPSQHTTPDWSAGSESQPPVNGGYGGNSPKSGSSSCSPGTPGCSSNKPSVSNPYPTQHKNPDWSTDSKSPAPVDSGYEGNSPNSGSRLCPLVAFGCPANKPSVSNSNPTQDKNPAWSASSKSPSPVDGGYGGNVPNSGSRPCAAGASGCSETKEDAYSSPSSQHKVEINYEKPEDNAAQPGGAPCYPGDPRCSWKKPKVTTLSPPTAGIIKTGSTPCSSGAPDCQKQWPGASNPNPTYQKNPALSGGSKHSTNVDGGYGGKAPTGGNKPGSEGTGYISNPFLNGEIDVSSIKDLPKPVEGSNYPGIKPNPSNPFLNPHSQVRPSTGTKHPETPNGSSPDYSESPSFYPNPANPNGNSPGNSEVPTFYPNPANPFLSHGKGMESTGGSKYPGIPQGTTSPSGHNAGSYPNTNGHKCQGTICTPVESVEKPYGFNDGTRNPEYPSNKPNPSNPFLSHNGEGDKTTGPNAGSHPNTSGHKCQGTICTPVESVEKPYGFNDGTKNPEYPSNKPNPSNPFLSHNGEGDKTTGPNAGSHPNTTGHKCQGTICKPVESVEKPYGFNDGSKNPEYPSNKPNPSNPFLSHNGEGDKTTGPKTGSHPNTSGHKCQGTICTPVESVEKPYGFNDGSKNPEYPSNKPNPSNPSLSHNGEGDKTTGINGHGNNNFGSSYEPGTLPEKETSGSNPSSDNGESIKPGFKPGPACQGGILSGNCNQKDLVNSGASSSVTEGYINGGSSNTDNQGVKTHQPGLKPGSGCQGGISSGNCNSKDLVNSGASNSVTEGYKNGGSFNTDNQGVKTHQPGVKGGSLHRGQSGQLQGGLGGGKIDLVNGKQSSSFSEAHASASASAHSSAHASSSSYSSGSPNSSAKSEAYSNASSSGSSHSWASSSASASASAFASSNAYASSGHWGSQIPEVPAE